MWKWFLIALAVIYAVLSFIEYRKEEKRKKLVKILLILIAAVFAIWGIYSSFQEDPSLRQPKALKPRNNEPKQPVEMERGGYLTDDHSGLFEVRGKNVVYQPFGLNVPFSICRNSDGLLVSTVIRDLHGDELAKIINNKWIEFPKKRLRKNFDSHAIEVIDKSGIPIFQVEYINPITVRVGGVFQTESANSSEMYDDFPSASGPPHILRFGSGTLIIKGQGMATFRRPQTDQEREDFRAVAKMLVRPWFDYSKPERLSVRNESLEVVQKLHTPLTKEERNKYSHLSNAQLKDLTTDFVVKLRQFIDRVRQEEHSVLDEYPSSIINVPPKTEETNSVVELLRKSRNMIDTDPFFQVTARHKAEYDTSYKANAIILREELKSRLPKEFKSDIPLVFYERPPNSIIYEKIADDLEIMADRLPR